MTLTDNDIQKEFERLLPNFHVVTLNKLYRSGHPTQEGFEKITKLTKIRAVLNLRNDLIEGDELYYVPPEFNYERIRMNAWHPETEDIVEALKFIIKMQNMSIPTLVHCKHGADRTGFIIAMYRILMQGWTKSEAIDEMVHGNFGYHWIWFQLPLYIRLMNIDKLRKKIFK